MTFPRTSIFIWRIDFFIVVRKYLTFSETANIYGILYNAKYRAELYEVYFFLNNQKDALIIQLYSVIKLYMFRASILTLLGHGHQKPTWNLPVPNVL
jgi:hypothetical protein